MPPSKLLFRVLFKRLSDNSKQYVFSENVETIINTYVPLKSKVDLEYLASLDIQGPLNYNAAIRKKSVGVKFNFCISSTFLLSLLQKFRFNNFRNPKKNSFR